MASATAAAASADPQISHWRIVHDSTFLTPAIITHDWKGSGTADDPYLIDFIPNDPRNPLNLRPGIKWMVAALNALATLAMTFSSSAYIGGVSDLTTRLNIAPEIVLLGVSVFVLGFAFGPLIWAPLSESFGRRAVFATTYGGFVALNVVAALANNTIVLLVARFFGGALGSSALVSSSSVIADMFVPTERGRVSAVFSAAPFLGPVLGPIVGGFLGQSFGWIGVGILLAWTTALVWMLYFLLVPETYAPVLLRSRAALLTKKTRGKFFRSRADHVQGQKTVGKVLRTALTRPWALLFTETIVILLSLYMAIIFGSMYLMFAAFPIVFQQEFGFTQGISGLAFLGIAVGMVIALVFMLFMNKSYTKIAKSSPGGKAAPEARLIPACYASLMPPLGLFGFAVTNSPDFHFMIPIATTVPFGFGMVVIFLSLLNYIVDTYTVYAGSAIAASTALRSLFGAAFPLFTRVMFNRLGSHFGAGVPAVLSLLCVPFPFLFLRYGQKIRQNAKYSQEARMLLQQIMEKGADKKERPLSDWHGPTAPGELRCFGRRCLGCDANNLFYCRNAHLYDENYDTEKTGAAV